MIVCFPGRTRRIIGIINPNEPCFQLVQNRKSRYEKLQGFFRQTELTPEFRQSHGGLEECSHICYPLSSSWNKFRGWALHPSLLRSTCHWKGHAADGCSGINSSLDNPAVLCPSAVHCEREQPHFPERCPYCKFVTNSATAGSPFTYNFPGAAANGCANRRGAVLLPNSNSFANISANWRDINRGTTLLTGGD